MNRRAFLLTATATAATAAAAAPPSSQRTVEALLEAQRQAWNRGDLVAFCAPYAEDAVFISPSGITRSRAEVLARYQKKYGGSTATMGTLSFEPVDVQAGIDIVTMAMRWQLNWTDKAPANGHTIIVWRQRGPTFQLVQDVSF
jgi:uncharacterized protein (TIGR02246 family)